MLELLGPRQRQCDGVTRRSFLRVGFLGLAGLSLADHLRIKAAAAEAGSSTKDTAVILLYMSGGPSHMDTYDLKPSAPAEFRGDFKEIATCVPGIRICEHMPFQAQQMDKMSIVRSLTHTNGGHGMATHWMMTGYAPSFETNDNQYPSCGSIIAKLRGSNAGRMPPYVCLPDRAGASQAAYIGAAYNPFTPGGDPNDPGFQVRDLRLGPRVPPERFTSRRDLLQGMGKLRRKLDAQTEVAGYDRFYQDAFEIVTGERCRQAFNLQSEDPRLRDRYGRDSTGQSALLARRLVEAGVSFVTVSTGYSWDTHENNFETLKTLNLPSFDHAVGTLVEDLHERGLAKKVLVVCYGEFGRTPRVNPGAGRDHWPGAMFAVLAGGGLKTGQVVGATDPKGEYPKTRPVGPQDVLATMYHALGIDYRQIFHDAGQRPIPILNEGRAIDELV